MKTKAQMVYCSVSEHHPNWRHEFAGWFTEFALYDGLSNEEAALKAAEQCGFLFENRGEGIYADPLARRQKQLGTRVRGQNRKVCAFYRTHEAFLKTL